MLGVIVEKLVGGAPQRTSTPSEAATRGHSVAAPENSSLKMGCILVTSMPDMLALPEKIRPMDGGPVAANPGHRESRSTTVVVEACRSRGTLGGPGMERWQ